MKKKTIFLGLLVAGISIFGLASCARKAKKPVTTPTQTNVTTTEVTPTTATTPVTTNTDTNPITTQITDPVTTGTDPTTLTTDPIIIFTTDVEKTFNVTFINGENETTIPYTEGDLLGEILIDSTKTEENALYNSTYSFVGWFDENNNKYTSTSTISSDLVLTAQYELSKISLNTKTNSATDVKDLVNDKNLTDVIKFTEYDMLTLFSLDKFGFDQYTFYIKNGYASMIYEVENRLGTYFKYNDKFADTYFYLPYVLENKNNDYSLIYNGKQFVYTVEGNEFVYGLDGYLLRYNNFYCIYDLVNTKDFDLGLIGSKKSATQYVLYEENYKNNKYYSSFYKDWIYSTDNKDIVYLLSLLPLSPKDIVSDMSKKFDAKVDYYILNNYCYFILTGSKVQFKLKFDELGYVREIDVINPKTLESIKYYTNPITNEVERIKEEEFINAVFNSSFERQTHTKIEATINDEKTNVEFYRIGERFVVIEGESNSGIINSFIPERRKDIISNLLNNGNCEFLKDITNELYILKSSSKDVSYEAYFDSYGQLVKYVQTSKDDFIVLNFEYELGEFAEVRIDSKFDYTNNLFVKKGELLTFIPEDKELDNNGVSRLVLKFVGYYLDPSYKNEFNMEKDFIQDNITLYALFKEEIQIPVKIFNYPYDNTKFDTIYVSRDAKTIELPNTLIYGYEFVGWFDDANFKTPIEDNGLYKEYHALYIPLTYSNYTLYGVGKFDMINNSLPTLSTTEFEYVNSIGVLGDVTNTIDGFEFITKLGNNTMLKFQVKDYATLNYYSIDEEKDKNAVGVFRLIEDLPIGQQLTNKVYRLENGNLIKCTNLSYVEEGIEYYILVDTISANEKGIMRVDMELEKKGTYLVVQAESAILENLNISYVK